MVMGAYLYDPGRDEDRKPVTPDVLVDGYGDEEGAGDGLVAIDCVGRDCAS
jgi:hypothetical protein